jgi:hypothetical protein
MNLIAIHLLRSEEVVRAVVGKLDPATFNSENERVYRWMWAVSVWYYKKYACLPSKDVMYIQLNEARKKSPGYFDASDLAFVDALLERAYASDYNNQEAVQYTLDLIGELIQDRVLKPKVALVQAEQSTQGFTDRLREVLDEQAATTVSIAQPTQLYTPGAGFSFESGDRRELGVDFFDYLCGDVAAGIPGVIPGSVILTLGVTGTGKSTLGGMVAVEGARRGLRTAYLSYEYALSPRVERMIYGYVGQIPRAVIDTITSDQELESEYRERLEAGMRELDDRMFMFDMVVDRRKGRGVGGPDEIGELIRQYSLDVVNIDQASSMMDADHKHKSGEEDRVYLETSMRRFQVIGNNARADGKPCTIHVLHQTDTEQKRRNPTTLPRKGAAANCKAMEDYSDVTLVMGDRDHEHRGWIGKVKGRNTGPVGQVITQTTAVYGMIGDMDGSRFELRGNKFFNLGASAILGTKVESESSVDRNQRGNSYDSSERWGG